MINKFIIAFLLFLPIASATISTVSTNQNLYPGEHFNITLNNDSPPTLINITVNYPCITQKSLLMKKTSQNLTVLINSSIPAGNYNCNFILSYNGTLTIVNPISSGGGGGSHHTTTTIFIEEATTTSAITSTSSTSTIENVPTTTSQQTTTTIVPKTLKEKFTFWNLFRFIILPLVLLLAALRFAIYLKEKKVPGL